MPTGESEVCRSQENPKHRAGLHDFCMVIPYGVVLAAAGVLTAPFGGGRSFLLAVAGGLAF